MDDLFSKKPKEETEDLAPLAERMRPEKLEDFVGQEEIVGVGTPLRKVIEEDKLVSIILWGPPGSGKTTLAKIIAKMTRSHFVSFSAVTSGIPALKKVIEEAKWRKKYNLQRTILFVDEIHRFNKTQQDAFLPYVEDGTIILIGATTENPSFEINSPLLSRSTVYILHPLSPENLKKVIKKALEDRERGLGRYRIKLDPQVMDYIVEMANGDARIALNILELSFISTRKGEEAHITSQVVTKVIQRRILRYDKRGEEHYNLISALHKSMRDSDPDASVYWLARMLEAGEDPLYIARRMVVFASEDVGNADPQALQVAVAAMQAVQFVGMPEANLALTQAAIYLACAPKSNTVLQAYSRAKKDIRETGNLPVPLVIRNAPTSFMKEIGYGRGYKYAHDFPEGFVKQQHLPTLLEKRVYYQPSERGYEKEIKKRMEGLKKKIKGQEEVKK
jgi:putative ATPase